MRVREFVRVLRAVGPRLGDLVIAGGWAWYLYRKYLTGERSLLEEFTRDVDVAVPRRLPSAEASLDELLAEADFKAKMSGEERPPVTRYLWPSADNPEATVEFLTPALGSGEKATLDIDGIVAQQLRFVDLLLRDPLSLTITEGAGSERFSGSVRVPRVGFFVWQKALTFPKRHDRAKREKDLFYIFDLADQSRGLVSRIGEDIRGFPDRGTEVWRQRAAANLTAECGEPDSSGIGKVLDQIPPEGRPQRRYVHETFLSLISVLEGR
jgi:hypothetical protein